MRVKFLDKSQLDEDRIKYVVIAAFYKKQIIEEFGDIPESEIEEVKLVKELPDKLTYPEIQPQLFEKVLSELD